MSKEILKGQYDKWVDRICILDTEEEYEPWVLELLEKQSRKVFKHSMQNVFGMAAYQYSKELLDISTAISEKMADKHTNFDDLVNHIITACKRKSKSYGDLTVNEFKELIHSYYFLDHKLIQQEKEIQKKIAKEARKKREEAAKSRSKVVNLKDVTKEPPKPKQEQMSLFSGGEFK